ncbi:MAG TPA: HlyD family efflux transporter periplasmic adaptor subunit [Sphingomicrobium sp.]|nr:HlyD family efflux transporter periplasmic adaptor subunit [Sphingomicrobium sp.]
MSRRMLIIIAVVAVAAAFIGWKVLSKPSLPDGIAAGNGRLEANELFISSKYPGRIKEVLVNEGDTVSPGQVVARLDTEELEANLRQAEAQIAEAQETRRAAAADIGTKRAQVNQRIAQIDAKQADFNYAAQQYARSQGLVKTGAVSQQEAQLDNSTMLSTRAQVASSRADLAAAQADLAQAQATAGRTTSTIEAARADADRIRAQIKDAVLVAPMRGRIERRLAEAGEVVGAGGRVYSLVDLSDVYMYIFLPEKVTGKLRMGSEARIVLDAAPQYPIRAYVSYVSPTAQFTPKTVETAEERHNLTFRVKLQIPKERLQQYEALVKAGVPGVGYVRFSDGTEWPVNLQPPAKIPSNMWNASAP